jgi:hypothetical protein
LICRNLKIKPDQDSGRALFYRSIFDLARDFLEDEAFAGEDKVLKKYLSCELLIIDASGSLRIPPHGGHPCLRLTVPPVGSVRDFHPLVRAPCRAHQNKQPQIYLRLFSTFCFP